MCGIHKESFLDCAMQDCASGQSPQHNQSSRFNAQLMMLQSTTSTLVNALHSEWYNNIPQDLAMRLRRPLLLQVAILLVCFIQSLSNESVELAGSCAPFECPTLSYDVLIHAMQDKAAGGLLIVNLDPIIRATISESFLWEQMQLSIPESILELNPMKRTLWRVDVKASAVARCYNKVCAFRSTSNTKEWYAISFMLMGSNLLTMTVLTLHLTDLAWERTVFCPKSLLYTLGGVQAVRRLRREDRNLFHDRMRQLDRKVLAATTKLSWASPKGIIDAYYIAALK